MKPNETFYAKLTEKASGKNFKGKVGRSKIVELKTCPNCKSPFLVSQKTCPRCGEDYSWDQESWLNVGCLVLMMLFALFLILLPVFMLGGMLFRW